MAAQAPSSAWQGAPHSFALYAAHAAVMAHLWFMTQPLIVAFNKYHPNYLGLRMGRVIKRSQGVPTYATDSKSLHPLAKSNQWSITLCGKAPQKPLSILPCHLGNVLCPNLLPHTHRISQWRVAWFRCPTKALQVLNPLYDFLPPFHLYHSTPQIRTSKIYINLIRSQSGQRSHVDSKTVIGLEWAITNIQYDGIWVYMFDSGDTAGLDVDAGLQYLCLCYGKFIFISILGSLSRALYLN